MKRLLLALAVLCAFTTWAFGASYKPVATLTNSQAAHELPQDGYRVVSYSALMALTNMLAGDNAFCPTTGEKWTYVGNPLAWHPYTLFPPYTPTYSSTPTKTLTITSTPTNSPSNTPTITPTGTITMTPTQTGSFTYTATATNSPTNSPTITPTNTPNWTPTPTFTAVFYSGNEVVLTGLAPNFGTDVQTAPISLLNGQATYSLTTHGFNTGDWVVIGFATPGPYNGFFQITSTATNTFTYAVPGYPATVSSGSSTVLLWMPVGRQVNPQLINNISFDGSYYDFFYTHPQTSIFYGRSVWSGQPNGIIQSSYFETQNDSISEFFVNFNSADPGYYFYIHLTGIQ